MFEETIYYQNTDVLLMDPCYSRDDDSDIDSELYCSDLVVDTYADGYYYAIKGRLEDAMDRIDEIAENPEDYSLGEFTLDTGRIGVYDYRKAIEEQPDLKERIFLSLSGSMPMSLILWPSSFGLRMLTT